MQSWANTPVRPYEHMQTAMLTFFGDGPQQYVRQSALSKDLKITMRYLPCGRYDKYDENVGADRRVCPTNTSNAILGGQTSPVQANNEEHPACLEESENLQIQEGEH